ncbi:hypothetical protein [Novosphingobium sp. 18052]|nr:hypothetical protein [Novosphingobium sp. 18052]
MPVWNLPAFRENAPFPQPANFGRWQLADGSLNKLGASLKVNATPFIDPHEPVRAIPDPWAQARSFAEALISGDVHHPLFATAVAQWRGLLALFALSERYRKVYTLSYRTFGLDTDVLFDRVLGHLTPQVAIGDQFALWEQPLLIFANEHPVAMGNPACLVSPGRLTPDLGLAHIPWYSAGLRDPLKCHLPVTDLFVLSAWLHKLWSDLGTFNGEAADRIRHLLHEYRVECDRLAGSLPFVPELKPSRHAELGFPYSLLFTTADFNFRGDPATTSATRLRLRSDVDLGEIKGVILVDKALTLDPRFDPRSTLVWGTIDLASLLNSTKLLEDVRAEAANSGWMIVTGDDIFTPRVARFENGARLAGNPAGMEDILAPLRPLALLFEGNLADTVSANVGAGKAIFTLRVRIEDGTEVGRSFDFNRQFATDPADGDGLLVDDEDWSIYHTAIWPNFRSSAWSNYFARFIYGANRTGYMVRPTRALSAQLIAQEMRMESAGFAAIDRLRELNGSEGPGYHLQNRGKEWSRSEKKSVGEYEDVQFSASPFEVITYVEAYGDRLTAPAGMALLQIPAMEPSSGAGDFDVAVDFGTTNTVACFDNGRPISFEGRLVYPLAYANANLSLQALQDSSWLGRWFFPPETRLTPTPTVALTRMAYPSQEKHPVFRNVIYFHSHEKHARNAEAEELRKFSRVASQAKFNLKWSDDAEHVEAARDFLSQFLMLIAAEALAGGKRDPRRIRWRFSAPDSLDGELRDKLSDNLREMTRPYSLGLAERSRRVGQLEPEGLVAAQFILNDAGFIKGSLNMVLDIGGGTTDVTIWDRDDIRWIGSFKLAGQNFFTRTISQNPALLSQIGLAHWEALFSGPGGSIEGVEADDIPHLAEMLFSGPALSNAIDEHWDSRLQYSAGAQLRLVAQTFLGGMAWYMGKIVRQLVADGLRPSLLENPAFALCGRGAGIFKKIHGGREPDARSDVTRTLQLFSVAAGDAADLRPQLFTTQDAKLEVVRGMIRNTTDMHEEAKNAARFYVSGLHVNFGGDAVFEPQDKVSRRDVPGVPEEADLSEFKAFVTALRDIAGVDLDLREGNPQGAWNGIRQAVEASITDLYKEIDPKKGLKPPFIVALETLVDIMASPAAKRDSRLKMDFVK